jgi:prepilin-type N-terminal cleavage/methylation domain-containing protein
MRVTRRSGFTLIETMIGVSVLAMVIGNVYMLQRASGDAYESGVFSSALEDGAEATMDRIALAVMSTSADSLDEVLSAPNFVSEIEYEVVTDVVDGQPIVGVPERIEFVIERGEVVWTRNPGQEDELNLVWSRYVPEMLEGEEFNGLDDNGNGIQDEQGLAFNRDINQVLIRLTLSRTDRNQVEYTRTRNRRVTCRN